MNQLEKDYLRDALEGGLREQFNKVFSYGGLNPFTFSNSEHPDNIRYGYMWGRLG